VAANRSGRLLRINSDAIAAAIATELKASKLIFLTSHPGLSVEGQSLLNLPAEELRKIVSETPESLPAELLSKVHASLEALANGTPRAHILDGRIFGALLTEVFDKVGLGTMIHSNEYDQIRPAQAGDLHALYNLIANAASSDAVRERSLESIEESLGEFFLYEIDGSLVACAALTSYPAENMAEITSVFVQPFYQGRGVGLKMIRYAERLASGQGVSRIFALSTQSYPFFREVCHFQEGTMEDLPQSRRESLHASGRRSKILLKHLGEDQRAS